MIGRLRGQFVEAQGEYALVDVMGVGYLVRCGSRTLARLPAPGEELVLHIESQTREDGVHLYGFLAREDREAFALLQAVQGVGPKAALSVLDVLPPGDLAAAVAREDKAAVGRANGVGAKLALRIVTELKGKPIGGGPTLHAHAGAGAPAAAQASITGEAVAALIGLAIAEPVARRAVEAAAVRLADRADLPGLIKTALQEIGR